MHINDILSTNDITTITGDHHLIDAIAVCDAVESSVIIPDDIDKSAFRELLISVMTYQVASGRTAAGVDLLNVIVDHMSSNGNPEDLREYFEIFEKSESIIDRLVTKSEEHAKAVLREKLITYVTTLIKHIT